MQSPRKLLVKESLQYDCNQKSVASLVVDFEV